MAPPISFGLEDRVAVVTGASRGIGEAIARCFAGHGCHVVLTSRTQQDLDAVADDINAASGGRAVAIACHTGRADDIDALFETVQSHFDRLDVLVNNAATNPFYGPATEITEAAFDKTVEVNLKGYFLMSQRAARMMAPRRSGSIINISSIAGLSPLLGQVPYSMTKAAVIAMTRGLAKELGSAGIRVNAIAPGIIETRFAAALLDDPKIMEQVQALTPLGRHGQPDEIAGAALYLASDASSYTTGSVIVCDGGATA